MGFDPQVPLIRQGDPVTPGTANRAPQAISGNVAYLFDLIQAAALGSTVFARRQTVEPAAAAGMPVYYNPEAQRFERGLARTEAVPVSGQILTAASAQVWGAVYAKANATLADILLFGYAPLDLSAAVAGTVAAGLYYLSGTTPGMLTMQRPPVSVAVLRADGRGNVFVVPQLVDFLDRHAHYRFALACRPAGRTSPPAPGERHAIADPDPTLPGWLPASDGTFLGRAPAGAVFGYNLAADPALADAWPPLPASQACLEWDRGLDKEVGATGVPLGPDGACLVDRNGIWWLHDCHGDVPWPTQFDTSDPAASSQSLSGNDQCPRPLNMTMTLWFTRITFAADAAVVASLRSLDSRITVACAGGGPGATGDLTLALDLDLVTRTGQDGYQVLKGFDGSTFAQGPACEGVYALSSNVTLTGAASRHLVESDPSSPLLYQGPVGIDAGQAASVTLDVDLVRVEVVEQDFLDDTMFLRFPAGQEAAIRGLVRVPADSTLPAPRLRLRFRVLGLAPGGLPALSLSARRVPRPPAGTTTPLVLPDASAEFAVTLDTAATLSIGDAYVEATSAAFDVAAGDHVYFSLGRSATDGYPGDVGLLDQVGVLSRGA